MQVKFGRPEIGKDVRLLDEEFRLALQLSLLIESRPKSAGASPQSAQSAPDFIQIGSLSAELYPNA